MSFQHDAQGPRGRGGPIDEEARWQAYQAWLRKKREGGAAAEGEPSTVEPPPPRSSPPPDREEPRRAGGGLIALTALILTGSVAGGVSLLVLRHGANGPAAPDRTLQVRTVTDQGAKLKPRQVLPCYVDGQSIGNVTLTECARRNGAQTGRLDVGVGRAPTASPQPTSPLTPAPAATPAPAGEPAPIPPELAQAPPRPPPGRVASARARPLVVPPVRAVAPRQPSSEASREPSREDPVGRLLDPEDSVRAVRGFYDALGQGDGARAAALVVPEKRRSGSLSAHELGRFYSGLEEPLRVLRVEPVGPDRVYVRYEFVAPNGARCLGAANVDTTTRGDQTLVSRIHPLSGC